MSSAETGQMSTGKTGRCPVPLFYICLVSAEDTWSSQQQTHVLSQQKIPQIARYECGVLTVLLKSSYARCRIAVSLPGV